MDILSKALEIVRNCPEGCERSCTKCLRHYGNRFVHARLDRHLAGQFLSYAVEGSGPPIGSVAEQALQLTPLRRYLELEGWSGSLDTTLSGVDVPLLLKAPGAASQSIAVGTWPALADVSASSAQHPLQVLKTRGITKVVLLNDYILARDLPTAYHQLLKAASL